MTHVNVSIRPFQADDEPAVVGVWHRSGRAAYAFLPLWQTLTLDRAGRIFQEVIRVHCSIWVGTLEQQVVAYLAMKGSYIDRMFVDPSDWRKGWGTRLVGFAKSLSPTGLELHTHQENHAARSLYEKHGFKAVKFGTSPPPEAAPDVEYHWRPDNASPLCRQETKLRFIEKAVIRSVRPDPEPGDLPILQRPDGSLPEAHQGGVHGVAIMNLLEVAAGVSGVLAEQSKRLLSELSDLVHCTSRRPRNRFHRLAPKRRP